MSLINDALRRAKAAQPNPATPADGPVMHLAREPRVAARAGNDFLLPAIIVVIFLLAAILLWMWFHGGSGEIQVRARTLPAAETVQPTPAAAPAPAPAVVETAKSPALAAAPAETNSTNSTTPATRVEPAVSTNPAVAVTPTNATPALPPPVTYKLQSIFYRAKNPCAVINGKTLFVGGHVGEAHVLAIDQESVTIVTEDGKKKVLELP